MPPTFKLTPLFFLPLLINILFSQNPDPQIGDECIAWNGEIGFYDCEMCCWPSDPDWLGDGWCDYMGGCGFEGPLYNCPELGYDCGDCNEDWDGSDPLGLCNSDCCEPGDFNCDSGIDVLDVVAIVNCIIEDSDCPCGDLGGDGSVNVLMDSYRSFGRILGRLQTFQGLGICF